MVVKWMFKWMFTYFKDKSIVTTILSNSYGKEISKISWE